MKFGKLTFKITSLNLKDEKNYDRFKSVMTKYTGAEGFNKENLQFNQINNGLLPDIEKKKMLMILNSNTVKSANVQLKESTTDIREIKKK